MAGCAESAIEIAFSGGIEKWEKQSAGRQSAIISTESIKLDSMYNIYDIESSLIDSGVGMAWREKQAWLALSVMVVAYGAYFALVAASERSMLDMLLLFGGVAIAQAVIMIVGSILLAVQAGKEARAKADERDRAIDRRGTRIAYFVLLTGMIVVGVVMPFSKQGWQISNAALLALVASEIVRYGVVVASYRRGWHG